MAEVLSRANKRPYKSGKASRTKKHIVTPLSAEQISRGVGVTRRDAALVRKVLLELGYISAESGGAKKASAVKRLSAKKSSSTKKSSGSKKRSGKAK